MLEEYISYGATKIAIPLSAPELKTIEQMPILLKNRVQIIDDTSERETLHRVLYNLRKEFEVKINEENDYLQYSKGTENNQYPIAFKNSAFFLFATSKIVPLLSTTCPPSPLIYFSI